MKRLLGLVMLACLLLVASQRVSALAEIDYVDKAKAKELGIIVRSKPAGSNTIRVTMDIKTDGRLKGFTYARLDMESGDKSLSATLQPDSKTPDTVVVSFSSDPTTLAGCTVLILVHHGERSMTGYRCRITDLAEPEK